MDCFLWFEVYLHYMIGINHLTVKPTNLYESTKEDEDEFEEDN